MTLTVQVIRHLKIFTSFATGNYPLFIKTMCSPSTYLYYPLFCFLLVIYFIYQFSSVQFSHSVVSDSL